MMKGRKGVSTIVATILMLAITIALAGTAWVYFNNIASGATQGVQITTSSCSAAGVVSIGIKNVGTNIIPAGAITVTQTAPSTDTANPATCCAAAIESGSSATYTDTCTPAGSARNCVYTITPAVGQAVQGISVPCAN